MLEDWFFAFVLLIGPAACIVAMVLLWALGKPKTVKPSLTLLEILVRDWPEWVAMSRVYQDEDGDLISCGNLGSKEVIGRAELARDRVTAVVTEAKWQAAKRASQAASEAEKGKQP